jgi:hypothetical protein
MIFESDEETVRHQVAQTITEIPYFALATKKQISEIIQNALTLNETHVKNKDLNSFASDVYRMKKPVKSFVIGTLNEKYGIDIKKLTDVPTFRSLALTEAEILKALASKTPEGSVLEKTLLDLAQILPAKDGAETIDLADFLIEMFAQAEYTESLNEASLMDYMDFSRVAEDLGKIGEVLKMLSPKLQDMAGEELDDVEDMDNKPDLGSEDPMDSGDEVKPGMDADKAAKEVVDDEGAPEEGEEEEEIPEEEKQPEGDVDDEPEEVDTQESVLDALNQLETLLSGILKDEDGGDDDEEEDEEEDDQGEMKKDPEKYKS